MKSSLAGNDARPEPFGYRSRPALDCRAGVGQTVPSAAECSGQSGALVPVGVRYS